MSKKDLSEADICLQFITPAILDAGWERGQIRCEFPITDGRIIVRGALVARGKNKRADYVLFYKTQPIAIIEAKNNQHSIGAGMQQALGYAELTDIPFVFSSNGDGFRFHDRSGMYPKVEQTIALEAFPSPAELWGSYQRWRGLEEVPDDLILSPYYVTVGGKEARYYQRLAINRTIEAIARGQRRCLLVMATGTGKTFTVFNIIWRLWKARRAKRILFLADRNILVDQTMVNDFQPFGGVMTKLDRSLVDESGRIDTSYEIYLGLYQAIIGNEGQEDVYTKFDRNFFDLIVIDECHRGSAAEDSNWRQVLSYFESAVQIGLTATPKETKYVSNIDYFGEPVYTYSLKQGIEDGFLAPFKVIRVDLDVDLQGWRPEQGEVDDAGELIEDRVYNLRDFDRNITFTQRSPLVAEYISNFLHEGDPMRKTIVFCEGIPHAQQMREALVNVPANRELVQQDHRYVMQITGDEKEGKARLDNFIDPKRAYPVIATTSKLMSTGVDAQTCHVIVLDRRIQSMTEFKQIVGRGTRLRTDYGKHFFTIIDFRNATQLFADEDWDGPPIQDGDFGETDMSGSADEEIGEILALPPEAQFNNELNDQKRYVVGRQEFRVSREKVQYYGKDGQLVTTSLRDYTRGQIRIQFDSLDDFLRRWNESDRKQAIVDELMNQGLSLEMLRTAMGESGKDYDIFDLICHVAFDQPPLTRKERANDVKKRDVFTKYGEQARAVLESLLDKYADQGVLTIEDQNVLKLEPFNQLGTPMELVKQFGNPKRYRAAIADLEQNLYFLDQA